MKYHRRRSQIALLIGAWLLGCPPSPAADATRPNVLFIAVDDLRCALGCFGDEIAITPNIDRLASEGRLFRRHYVQSAVCGPSRSSMLTGTRVINSWDVWQDLRARGGDEPDGPTAWPHHFRRHGYRTVGLGKISHEPGGTMPPEYQEPQVPFAWDKVYTPTAQWKDPWHAFFAYEGGQAFNAVIRWTRDEPPRQPFEAGQTDDFGYADAHTAQAAVEELRHLDRGDQPFVLAVGFFKPHLPHNSPQSYWDKFPAERVGMVDNFRPPENVDPAISVHKSPELTRHYYWPSGEGNVSREEAIRQRRAYYACACYVDAQIGRVLDALRGLACRDNTIVVLWADHGWQLGEHHMFSKHTNYEVPTNSPLIIRTPKMTSPGQPADGLVETVDIYPTLVELCGLPRPEGLVGTSLRNMLDDPSAPGRPSAYTGTAGAPGYFGHALRTDRYRLIRWHRGLRGEVAQVELYDHETDPEEMMNVAADCPEIVRTMTEKLEAKMAQVQ